MSKQQLKPKNMNQAKQVASIIEKYKPTPHSLKPFKVTMCRQYHDGSGFLRVANTSNQLVAGIYALDAEEMAEPKIAASDIIHELTSRT